MLITSGTAGAIALAGCTSEGGSSGTDGTAGTTTETLSGDITITGSSTVFPLAEAIAETFQNDHPNVNIDISSTGSGGGFENHFCPGESDINNASRPIKDSEKSNCQDNDINPVELQVATDALTVVVNNDNSFIENDDGSPALTVDELEQIWGPDAASTWDEVDSNWPSEEINRFGAADTSGTFDYFTETIMGEEGAHTDDYSPTEQDREIVQGVKGDEYAIGYFGFSYYYNNPDTVTAVHIDDGDGPVEPTLDNAKSGDYTPLTRPLFTYPAESALQENHIYEFVKFMVEQAAVEDVVAGDVGYVPISKDLRDSQLDELSGMQ